jgi:phospholipase C
MRKRKNVTRIARALTLAVAATLPAACTGTFGTAPGAQEHVGSSVLHGGGSSPIEHVIIVIQENRTFDNMFHGFPGANTVNTGKGHGKTYTLEPLPLKQKYDLNHSHTQFLEDYDQGKGDGFDDEIIGFDMNPGDGCSDYVNHPTCWKFSDQQTIKQEVFSYVVQSDVQPYWTMASQYALGDNAFASNNGPTFVAHQYLIAGESGHAVEVPNAQPWGCSGPASETVNLLAYGQASPPVFSKATGHEVSGPFPCFTYPTIANNLDAGSVSWSYYVEGQQPGANLSAFMAIQQVYKGPDWKNVKSPDTQIFNDISNNQLPNVSWVMPAGSNSDHPGPQSGDKGPCWIASIVNAVGQSAYWNSTAIIVMWDDWGGWYDHVHPPQYPDPSTGAREGLGFRVPLIVVSPYAKAGYISHQQHEIASTLNFIEETFGLGYIGNGSPSESYADQRVSKYKEQVDDMFDYTQKPIEFQQIPAKCDARYFLTHPDNTPADTY